MTDKTPLILLPGLGADSRMFAALKNELPQIVTPSWIEPIPGESVAEYARRFAEVIDPGRPSFVGGASFGGVLAQELAAIMPGVLACFVIGSTRSERAKPWRIRVLRPITPFVGILPGISPLLVRMAGSWLRSPTRGVMVQLGEADKKVLRWGAEAILKWKPSPGIENVRVYQIHGERDRVFPIRLTEPDQVVPGAGHLVAITHPQQVIEYLQLKMDEVEHSPR